MDNRELTIRNKIEEINKKLPPCFALEHGDDAQHVALRNKKRPVPGQMLWCSIIANYSIGMLLRFPDLIIKTAERFRQPAQSLTLFPQANEP